MNRNWLAGIAVVVIALGVALFGNLGVAGDPPTAAAALINCQPPGVPGAAVNLAGAPQFTLTGFGEDGDGRAVAIYESADGDVVQVTDVNDDNHISDSEISWQARDSNGQPMDCAPSVGATSAGEPDPPPGSNTTCSHLPWLTHFISRLGCERARLRLDGGGEVAVTEMLVDGDNGVLVVPVLDEMCDDVLNEGAAEGHDHEGLWLCVCACPLDPDTGGYDKSCTDQCFVNYGNGSY